jgi:hypothetical protein
MARPKTVKQNPHTGGSLDDFMKETLTEVEEVNFNNKALSIIKDPKTNDFVLVGIDFESNTNNIGDKVEELKRSPHIGIIVEAFKEQITKLVFHKMGA